MNKILSDTTDWDVLLEFIEDKQLTVVVGKELYKFKENDTLFSFEEYLAQKLFEAYKITDQPAIILAAAVNYLETEKRVKSMDINRKLKSLVKEIDFEFPLLTELSGISNLNYFINTAVYNNFLETKLNQLRKETTTSINFSINEPFSDADDLEKIKEPFVFNVFGSLLNTVDPALSEDDMLEYTGYFKEKMKNATNIVNALQNKNLLFLGCNFPDWMFRFMIRFLSNEPMHEWGTKRTVIVVNDDTELRTNQFAFLEKYDAVTFEGNTEDFIHELSTRRKARAPQTPVSKKNIFLSYTVKDKEAVENLKTAIESIGNVNCWYDKREINAGDDYKTEIAKGIKSADLFIPLISENSLLHKDGYVQLEWFTADNVNTFRKIDGNKSKYLMPIVIDDSNPYDANVPKYFAELSIGKVLQGNPDPEFLKQIKDTLQML